MSTTLPVVSEISKTKEFFNFILKNHLSEATSKSVNLFSERELPLLKKLQFTEAEFFKMAKDSLEEFVVSIINDDVIATAVEKMEQWKINQNPYLPKEHLLLNDLIIINSSRKIVFYNYISLFTNDLQEALQIATEIEALFAKIELISFNTVHTAHNDDLKTLNITLQEHQEELQTTNEELKESHEELQAINEELREQIEIRITIEESLDRERTFLKTILENVGDSIVACDQFGVLSYFNRKARELHGVSESALNPETWSSTFNLYKKDGVTLMSKEDVPLYRAFAGEVIRNEEMVILNAIGIKRTFLVSGERLVSSEGKTMGAVVVMRDITDIKIAAENEARLLKEEAARIEADRHREYFQKFFISAPMPIALFEGENFIFKLVNTRYQEDFFPNRQLLGKPMVEALPELEGNPIIETLRHVYKTGEKFVGKELLFELDKGKGVLEPGYYSFIIQPTYSLQNTIDGIAVVAYEVTDQVTARQKIEESEANLKIALEAGKMGTWSLDLINNISFRTIEHDRIFGYDKLLDFWGYDQFISHVLPEDKELVEEAFRQAANSGELVFECRIVRLDGEKRWIAVRGKTLYTNDSPDRMAGIVMDITSKKLNELELQSAQEELAAINEELLAANEEINANLEDISISNEKLKQINSDLDNFIYTASHDLKAPIANIEGLVRALSKSLPDDSKTKVEKILSLMDASILRFKNTINDLTDVVKIQKLEEAEETINLGELIEEVKMDLNQLVEESHAKIDINNCCSTNIKFSRKNLKSIIYNLLSNAVKYRCPSRECRIQITCSQEDGYHVLKVKDNGLGMDLEKESKIFSMFKRLHSHVEGSGIGLYIVKKIIENAGGRIEVQSEVDKGSTFTVYLKS